MACDCWSVMGQCSAVMIVLLVVFYGYGIERYLQMNPFKLREGVRRCGRWIGEGETYRHVEGVDCEGSRCLSDPLVHFFMYTACCDDVGLDCCQFAQDWMLIVVPLVAAFFLWLPVIGCFFCFAYCFTNCCNACYKCWKWLRARPARRAAAKAAGRPYGLRRIAMSIRMPRMSEVVPLSLALAVVLVIMFFGFGIERYLHMNPFKLSEGDSCGYSCSGQYNGDPVAHLFVYGDCCEEGKWECCTYSQDWLLIVLPLLATWPFIWVFFDMKKYDKIHVARAAEEVAAAAAVSLSSLSIDLP